jgi:cell wall-associated NlpC family hydrolase
VARGRGRTAARRLLAAVGGVVAGVMILLGVAASPASAVAMDPTAAVARAQASLRDAAVQHAEHLARARQTAANDAAATSIDGGTRLDPATVVVGYALAQLGKPYVWGGEGPDVFDCSGLTMRSWERGGVTLNRHSSDQWNNGRPVKTDAVRAGDLVFFGSDPLDPASIDHVALAIGDGMVVEAPHPGATVRIASMWRTSLVGAVRVSPLA